MENKESRIKELKVLVYDCLAQIEMCQATMKTANEEIAKLTQEIVEEKQAEKLSEQETKN